MGGAAEGPRCPRCGGRGYIERRRRGSQTYIYFHHRFRDGGRVRVRTCYIGPEEYEYVERFNPIGLRSIMDGERFYKYARSIIENLTPGQLMELKRLIEERLGVEKAEAG
jgi:hypothetical protein